MDQRPAWPCPAPASPAPAPAPFLLKTYEIVDDPTTDAVVSWGPSGTSFIIWDAQHFCQHLLPLHFKHDNFSSFIRQLNIYGFRKCDPDRWEFTNSGFVRGQHYLLQGIRRRTSVVARSKQLVGASAPSSMLPRNHDRELEFYAQPAWQNETALAQCTTQMQDDQLALQVSGGYLSDVLPIDICSARGGWGNRLREEQAILLKREKNLLLSEVTQLQHELHGAEQSMQAMWQRMRTMEEQQHHMLAFVAQAAKISSQESVLATIIGQQPQQLADLLKQQVELHPFISAAQPWSGISRTQRKRLQLTLPSLENTNSTVPMSNGGYLSDTEGVLKLTWQGEAMSPASPGHKLSGYVGKRRANSTSNLAGLCLQDSGLQHLSLQAVNDVFPTDESQAGEKEQLHADRGHLQFRSHSACQLQSSLASDHCLREHSYKIVKRQVGIGASLVCKEHEALEIAECGGTAHTSMLTDHTETTSSVDDHPVEVIGYRNVQTGLSDETLLQVTIQRQSGTGVMSAGSHNFVEMPGLSSCRRHLLNKEPLHEQDGTEQLQVARLPSIMSSSDVKLLAAIPGSASDIDASYEQVLESVQNVQQLADQWIGSSRTDAGGLTTISNPRISPVQSSSIARRPFLQEQDPLWVMQSGNLLSSSFLPAPIRRLR